MSAPTVTITLDKATYQPGEQVTATAVITDPDTHTEQLKTSGEVDGVAVEVIETRVYTEEHTITWLLGGVTIAQGVNPLVYPAPAQSKFLTVRVVDGQENVAGYDLQIAVVPSAPSLVLGCAINKLPSPSSATRSQRWKAFETAIGTAPRALRAYLSPTDTTRVLAAYEQDPARDPWAVISATPDSAGDIWTPGTPHPHDVILSWKPVVDDYLAGRYDGLTQAVADRYPGPGQLRWTAYHEPYDDVVAGSLNLANWQAVISHHLALTTEFDHVEIWQVLTGEQFEPQFVGTAKDPARFYVPGVYGVAGDRYDVPSVRHDGSAWWTPERMFDPYTAWCQIHEVAPGLWEYGAAPDFNDPGRRSRDLLAVHAYCVENRYEVLSWFDATGPKGDWQVDSSVVRLVTGSAGYYPKPLGPVQSITADPTSAATWHGLFTN